MRKLVLGSVLVIALQACLAAAHAEDVISLPGGNAVLNAPKSVVASVILAPGGDRQVAIDSSGPHKQLTAPMVFTRQAYASLAGC